MTRPDAAAPWPTAATRPIFLFGWPVKHSLSPQIHNAAFAEQALDNVYLAAPTPPEQLDAVIESLGLIGAIGANVTVPHKQAVYELCDVHTDEAELIGAVNTLVWSTEGLLGDNTDATGLRDAITADVHIEAGANVLLFGSGGAARAAVVATGRLGANVTVAARRPDAAAELAELALRAGAASARSVDSADTSTLSHAAKTALLVMNTTPLGMSGETLPDALMELGPGQIAYDLIYEPAETPFLAAARTCGAQVHNGLGMLVAQAAASYRRWTGVDAPIGLMSAVATAALAERARSSSR